MVGLGAWSPRRLVLAALAGALLVSAALLGQGPGVQAQEGDVGLRLSGLVERITQTIADSFTVELTNLTATEAYQVIVASDSAALGIGACGAAAQTRTVTGAATRDLTFIVRACAVGEGTITAEVRRPGASSPAATVSQRLTVEALPAVVIEASGETRRTGTAQVAAAQAATAQGAAQVQHPGFVRGIRLTVVKPAPSASVKVTWNKNPANSGPALTGFGLLFWRKGEPHPNYANALVKGAAVDSHTYTGLRPGTYQFRIHACNGSGSCGWWTDPPKEVVVPEPPRVTAPGKVRNLRFSTDHESFTVSWQEPLNNGGAAITGYGILQWRDGTRRPGYGTASTVSGRSKTYPGLQPSTKYWVMVHACNGRDRCGAWTDKTSVTTDPTPPTPAPTAAPATAPGPVTNLRHTGSGDNSVTVAWGAPSSDGGAALTGFHVKHRVLESGDWPEGAAIIEDGSARSRTIGGLVDGTLYDVQVRACNAASLCGGWTELLSRDREIVAGHRVGNASLIPAGASIAVGERLRLAIHDIPTGKTAYAQMYGPIQPAGRCPSGRAVIAQQQRGPGPSRGQGYYDTVHIEGCAPGGIGWLRVVNAAETELYARATIRVGTRKPGQVSRPNVLPRDAALYVSWTAPSDGGSAITHYDVQYRAGTAGAWTATEVTNGMSTTITGLVNGTSYQVQVRAANAKGDGDWSEIVMGTPQATVFDPVSPPTTAPSLSPHDICGTSVPSARLDKPSNLDIIPLPNRRAILVWTGKIKVKQPGRAASKFVVQVRETGESMWEYPIRNRPESGDTMDQAACFTIDLGAIMKFPTGRFDSGGDEINIERGFEHARAFDFQVTAIDGADATDAHASDTLTIIDTPIVAVNGDSPGSSGQAKVGWSNIEDVLPLTQGAQHGKYLFAIRKFASGHSRRDWVPGSFNNSEPYRQFIPTANNRNLISPLDVGELYAIQFRWNGLVSGEVMRIRAARDAYVWPSANAPSNGDIIASYPIHYPLASKILHYRICKESFPEDTWEQWEKLIPHAFDQWEAVGNQWGATGNLVTLDRELEPCTVYGDPADKEHDTFIERVSADVTEALRPYLDAEGVPATIPQSVKDRILAHVEAIVVDGYGARHGQDILVNEVILFDDVQLNIDGLISAGVFPQMAPEVGHFWCWGLTDGSDFTYNETLACVQPSRNRAGEVISSDLFLRHSKVAIPGDLLIPGGDVDVNRDDVSFNTCPAGGSNAYAVLVHEAGHMLGIRGPQTGTDAELAHRHPTIQGASMMVAALEPVVGCSPHPFDVMVLYAIYQSR